MELQTAIKADMNMLIGVVKVTLISIIAGLLATYVIFATTTSEPQNLYVHLPYVLKISGMVSLLVTPPIALSRLKQRRALHLAYEKLKHMVRFDQLTGLLSRGTFFDEVEPVLENSGTNNDNHAIAYIDLDHFKKINDRHGHATGDEVLRLVGQVFRKCLSQKQLAGRMGGEEFAVFLPNCSAGEADDIIQDIANSFRNEAREVSGIELNCTLSAGITISTTRRDLDKLLSEADQLLYMAKKSGRDNVLMDSPQELAA